MVLVTFFVLVRANVAVVYQIFESIRVSLHCSLCVCVRQPRALFD